MAAFSGGRRTTRRRAVLVLLAPLVLVLGLTDLSTAPPAVAAPSFSVTVKAPTPVLVGTRVVVRGGVTPAASGAAVRLQRYRSGSWSTIRTTRLDGASRYRFTLGAGRVRTLRLRVVKPAGSVLGRRISKGMTRARTVRVVASSYDVSLTADRTEIFDGAAVRFAGAITPEAAGAVVRLQQETATGWGTVASTSLGKRSRFRFVRTFATAPETTRFRVVKPASATVVPGQSAPVELRRRTWSSVTAGTYDTCGLTSDDAGWCWGWDNNGEVGNGDPGGTFDTPQPVAGGHRWLTLDAGSESTCGVRRDGSAWCWGDNTDGQLGTGSTSSDLVDRPVRVAGDFLWRDVSVGHHHACGLQVDGTAWCWGQNDRGQLGDGTADVPRVVPVPVAGGATWRGLDAGGGSTCGVQTDGSAWCWGADHYGQLGDGPDGYASTPEARSTVPVRVSGPTDWTSVRAGVTACGVAADASGWCWGSNTNNNLGYDGGLYDQSDVPVQVAGDWVDIVPGAGHVCGLQVDASAWCWGVARNGATGSDTGAVVTNGPVQVAGDGEWTSVSAGYNHTCGMQADRTLWCWGSNDSGELGVGDRDTRRTPVQVAAP